MLEVDLYYRFSCACHIVALITLNYPLYQDLLERLLLNCLIRKLPTFYKSREFIAIFIKSCNPSGATIFHTRNDCTVKYIILLSLLLFSTYVLQPSRLIVRSGLDVPTFATRRLQACHHARTPSGGRWNCGREMSGNFA
jgi:hypothetical protein